VAHWYISLTSRDGTVIPLYNRSMMALTLNTNPTVSNASAITETAINSTNPETTNSLTSTTFYFGDHLGSTQMIASAGGWPLQSNQFMPFGQEIGADVSPNHYKFTGKERDTESGLDYFGARYYASTMGRWMNPDPAMESEILEIPQTWNRYSYVYNRPTFATDPDGRCPPCVGALVGGIAEGGWNLGSQLLSNGGHLGAVQWGVVGAHAAGGAVAGAIAGATGGASLLVDAAVGAGANVVGGATTRALDDTENPDNILDGSHVLTDAVSGFVGGGVGHVAAGLVHVPDVAPKPNAGRDKLAKWAAANASRRNRLRIGVAAGTVAGSPPTNLLAPKIQNQFNRFWDYLGATCFCNNEPTTSTIQGSGITIP
jgi:RHS repeat-associated protein